MDKPKKSKQTKPYQSPQTLKPERFTEVEESFIVERRLAGESWEAIRGAFNRRFKSDKSAEAIRHCHRKTRRRAKPGVHLTPEAKTEKPPHPLLDFTRESLGSIVKSNDHRNGVFFVTAASPTSYVDYSEEEMDKAMNDEDFEASNLFVPGFDAVKNYLNRRQGQLVILPMRAHVRALKCQPQHYDPLLKPHMASFATEYTFNAHLKAIEAQINPQQINPLTGLKRFKAKPGQFFADLDPSGELQGQVKRFKTSLLIAHAKQNMEVVPTGNSTHPRIIHSTGAITKPAYLRNRIGMIADQDHILGGLIIEIDDDIFHVRQVRMDPRDGSFVDCGVRYFADGRAEPERAEAFKMGDIHPGFEDPVALNAWYEIWDAIKPKRIFLEDFFDGCSITHHLENKKLTQQQLPEHFKSLEAELANARRVLAEVRSHAPSDAQFFLTASNHPEHVDRWLDEGRYVKDKVNYAIGHRMVVAALDGKVPLQEFLDPGKSMTWLDQNEDMFVEGVQMNSHGHLGVNGSKGGKAGQEMTYGDAATAHTHTPGIHHDLFTAGHSTTPRHGYNNGPTTWILGSIAIYRRGQKQLHMVIRGKWRLP